jgi:hypothetical protein
LSAEVFFGGNIGSSRKSFDRIALKDTAMRRRSAVTIVRNDRSICEAAQVSKARNSRVVSSQMPPQHYALHQLSSAHLLHVGIGLESGQLVNGARKDVAQRRVLNRRNHLVQRPHLPCVSTTDHAGDAQRTFCFPGAACAALSTAAAAHTHNTNTANIQANPCSNVQMMTRRPSTFRFFASDRGRLELRILPENVSAMSGRHRESAHVFPFF